MVTKRSLRLWYERQLAFPLLTSSCIPSDDERHGSIDFALFLRLQFQRNGRRQFRLPRGVPGARGQDQEEASGPSDVGGKVAEEVGR